MVKSGRERERKETEGGREREGKKEGRKEERREGGRREEKEEGKGRKEGRERDERGCSTNLGHTKETAYNPEVFPEQPN